MRPLLLGVLLLAASTLSFGGAVAAQEPPPADPSVPVTIDGAAIAADLAEDPIAVLPGAPARFDLDRVRREMAAAEPSIPGAIYLVVTPFSFGTGSEVSRAMEGRLADDDQLIIVQGLQVTVPSWIEFAGGAYADRPYNQLWTQVNTAHQQRVLENHDLTLPVIDLLRLVRGAPPTARQPSSVGQADPALLGEIVRVLRRERMYVSPELDVTEDDRLLLEPVYTRAPIPYRLVYLPSEPLAGRSSDLVDALGQRFPGDVTVVVRGHWLQAAGPGEPARIAEATRAGRESDLEFLLTHGHYDEPVHEFFQRLETLARGALDPREIPARVEDTGVLGTRLGVAAFTATSLGLAAVSVGGWWLVVVRRRDVEARRFRLARARTLAALARFAAGVGALGRSADRDVGHRQAQIGERYTTALSLMEQARTSRQLDTARAAIADGERLLGTGPGPAARQRSAVRRPGRKSRAPVARRSRGPTGSASRPLLDLHRPATLLLVAGSLAAVTGFGVPQLHSLVNSSGTPMTPEAARAIEGLRDSSVHLEPGSGWTLDVAAARQTIGDRPILVVGFADEARFDDTARVYTEEIARYEGDEDGSFDAGYLEPLLDKQVPTLMTCRAIAVEYPDSFVQVIPPEPNFAESCLGPGFPEQEDDDMQAWEISVSVVASVAADAGIANGRLNPFVEELVASYEQRLDRLEDTPGERFLGGPYRTLQLVGYTGLAVAAATTLFLGSRRGTAALQRLRAQRRRHAAARARATAEAAELAGLLTELERDEMLRPPGEQHSDALTELQELSDRYLQVVIELEEARSTEQLGDLTAAVGEITEAARQRLTTAAGS